MGFPSGYGNPPGPATDAFAVTPSDTVSFTQGPARALYIGVTGDVVAVCASGAVTFKAVPVGWFPVNCTRVNATNTTATNIVGLL
jgi:hypothetical protein